MKTIKSYITFTILVWLACNNTGNVLPAPDSTANTSVVESQSSINPHNLFTLSDAEKVMGEPAHLMDSSSKAKGQDPEYPDSMSIIKKDATTYNSGYMANTKDETTGMTGVVYFGFEQYSHDSLAKKVYAFYKNANTGAIGFKELYDIGDEAWFGSSPLFIYVRKADKIFILKVNKMTSKTSLYEFNLAAKKIVDSISKKVP